MLFIAAEGLTEAETPEDRLKGRKGASMHVCNKMARSTLPFVLLKTHVNMMAVAMAKRQNLTIARGLLPPDASAQEGTINMGRCHSPHSSPRMMLPTKGPRSGCRRGSAKPRQPISSNRGPPKNNT